MTSSSNNSYNALSPSDENYDRLYDEAYDELYEELYEETYEEAYEDLCDAFKDPKKREYIDRDHEKGQEQLWNDYFSETPTYLDRMFRRRFRMKKPLFLRIVNELSTRYRFFQQRRDATGRFGFSALQKCTAAIRILAYGKASDAYDEYLRIAATTALSCLEHFVQGIIDVFGAEYLRAPTQEDLNRLLQLGEERGFPGMLGSIDCMHWTWKNCPREWRGEYSGRSGRPTIVLEDVASQDLWIWHAYFGAPGTLNDLNILERSPVFNNILHGHAPNVNYVVNGTQYNLGYYLTDGIYPNWATFIQSIRLPQSEKHCKFAEHQEAARKDVERAFGVLQARFAVIKNPALFHNKVKIGKIMRACIILHNMIVEDERAKNTQFETSDFQLRENSTTSRGNFTYSTSMPTNVSDQIGIQIRLRDILKHEELKNNLVEHIWQQWG